MRGLLLITCMVGILAGQAFGSDVDDVAAIVQAVVPSKKWSVSSRSGAIEVVGPSIRAVWPISLPVGREETIWRDYSFRIRPHIIILVQARIADSDLSELRELRARLAGILKRATNKPPKDMGGSVKEYGAICVPDFQTRTASIFVRWNLDGYWTRSYEAPETVLAAIRAALASHYSIVEGSESWVNLAGCVRPERSGAVNMSGDAQVWGEPDAKVQPMKD